MYICNIYSVDAALRVNFCKCDFVISESISDAVDRQTRQQTMLKLIKLNENLDKRSCTHRFDTLKLLPLLYLLQLANILQRRLLKVLPYRFHRHVCLKDRQHEQSTVTLEMKRSKKTGREIIT